VAYLHFFTAGWQLSHIFMAGSRLAINQGPAAGKVGGLGVYTVQKSRNLA